MRQSWLGMATCGFAVLAGCGATTTKASGNGGQAADDLPTAGTNASGGASGGTQPMPDPPKPEPGGTAGTSAGPGTCLKLCVNTASFVFYSPFSAEELAKGTLKACHNHDQECYVGVLPPPNGGNNVAFMSEGAWNGPTVWSPDDWRTIEFSWSSINNMALRDGDFFSLSLVTNLEEGLLLDSDAIFETVKDCAGSCRYVRYDLRSNDPVAGAPSTGDAGASFGPEAGSAGEGGAPSL